MIELIIARGLTQNSHCRLCKEQQESATSLAACKMLASSEYLARQNSACGDGC